MAKNLVLGIDFGTDSVRAVLVDAAKGRVISAGVHPYKRWSRGLYCDPARNRFRQHPLDYREGLEKSVKTALAGAPAGSAVLVRGIAVDTTASTPVALDRGGTPLALLPGFAENPNAMFILWKDHTAISEAEEINRLARGWGGTDFTIYSGGIYSSEWFWSKILHILREDRAVAKAAYSWAEHCDWMTAELTGTTDPAAMRRSRCAAGHKAMWHESFGGLPSEEFLARLDPRLAGLRERLYTETFTADMPAGRLCAKWAKKLGLPAEAVVSVGSIDAHIGAVGGEIAPGVMVKVMGTSTCDMITAPLAAEKSGPVRGICGQVDGSILPGMLGMEAGQSAFGDIYAWFRDLLSWPLSFAKIDRKAAADITDRIISELSREAAKIPIGESGLVAVDWLNGRRTPDADATLTGAIFGLSLGSDAPRIFRALVESSAFGSLAIIERFRREGVKIREVVAVGGVAKKSPFVMQTVADVLDLPIKAAKSEQPAALGAAMCAAAAAGLYPSLRDAQKAMGGGFEKTYIPVRENARKYRDLYRKYLAAGSFIEKEFRSSL